MNTINKNFGIYIHIPFCVSKCTYCSFVSGYASDEQVQEYVNNLCSEINLSAEKYKDKIVTSIYIGGGTPSFIDALHIEKILNTIKQSYNVAQSAEISIECNPCSFSKEKATTYKNSGVNRISFGVQSLCENQLKILSRKHSKDMAIWAIKTAQDVGFKNISADLMIGIPNQQTQDLIYSATQLINLGIKHISAYMLILEEGTPLYESVKSKKVSVADDDKCVDMYNCLVKFLKDKGFNRYEISNFAKSKYECKHNINYWDMGEYVGFGVASHSYVNGVRFFNSDKVSEYFKMVENLKKCEKNNKNTSKNAENIEKNEEFNEIEINFNNFNNYKTYERLSKKEIIEETIMLGLRQQKGVNIIELNKLNYDILTEKKEQINTLLKNKIIKIENNHIKLTPQNFGLCSAVILQLI